MSQTVALSPEFIGLLQHHDLFRSLLRRLVVAEAVGGVAVSPDESRHHLEEYVQRFGLADDTALREHLRDRGVLPSSLQWNMDLPLRIERYCEATFLPKAEAHFLERKSALDTVVYSLVRVQDPFLARELYLRLAEGEASFADLASEYSEGPEKATRGIVGPQPLLQSHPEMAERLRTSEPGQLLEPFRIEQWWIVAQLEAYHAARFDDAMGRRMAKELFQQWVDEEVTRKLRSLFSAAEAQPPAA